MWVPWMKKSSIRTHTKSPSLSDFSFVDHHPTLSAIQHHSPSLKDIESLFNNPPSRASNPLHKHSLSSINFPSTPVRSPTHSVFFKDIDSLLYDDDPTQTHSQNTTRKSSIFQRVKTWAKSQAHQALPPPDSENKVVVYFTSLRVVRRTYEDCRAVRSILKGYRVKMDERDLSMDRGYVEELQRITAPAAGKKGEMNLKLGLPKVYVNGKLLGGVEEIRRLHESGELKRLIQGLPFVDGGVCNVCGGFRFTVCEWCDGSHRVFVDKFGFKSCGLCNVNGLIQCRYCTSVVY